MRENAALITSVNKDKETNASFYDQRSGMTHKQKTTTLFNKCTRFQQENDNCEGKIGRPTYKYIQKTVTLLHRKRYLLKIFKRELLRAARASIDGVPSVRFFPNLVYFSSKTL